MTKGELIDEIIHLNPTASPDFLAAFDDEDLFEYLHHLKWVVPPTGPTYAVHPRHAAAEAPLFEAAHVAVGS